MSRFFNSIVQWWERSQPDFWRRMRSGYRAAVVILVLVVLWIGSGLLKGSDQHQPNSDALAKSNDIPRVQVMKVAATNRNATVTVRGRTEALHAVDVRAETDGVVQAIHFEKGDRVKAGQILCELRVNDRVAKQEEARALVSQREKEYAAAANLAKLGYVSDTQAKQSAAALEAAQAQLRTTDITLANTKIRAPFDGLVDDRYVNEGDYMRVGDKCAMIVAPEPFLAVGAVSERNVGQVKIGDPASATLVTGETVQGKVRFVADRAELATRTFRIEVELPNPDAHLRDGVSADIHIPVKELKAMKISPGILVLNDSGVIGVRIVENGIVHFRPVEIVSDGPDGMWVAGLREGTSVITVGQEFVNEGARVKPVQAGARA